MSWQIITVKESLATVKRAGKIQKSDYQTSGKFPIIDQGQSEIAGYCDNEEIVHKSPLPIVIFGDHTRRVKIAKEPFVCGADGTQLLYPKDDGIDPIFYYYAIKNIDLSNYFYARHFKFLKDQEFQYTSITSQKRVASILSAYDDLIENNRRRIALLEEVARLLYREWFVHFRFPSHEHVKMVDGVPEGWVEGRISDLGLAITGKTPSKKVDANFGDDVPFIKTPDMHGNVFVIETEESLSEQGVKTQSNKTLPIGSVLVSCIGTVGAVAMNASPAQTNQQINAVVPKYAHWQFFAFFALKAIKPRLEAMGGGATMANVNKTKFESVPILIPSDELILSFHVIVKPQFDLIEKLARQNRELSRARDLLLPRLMDGRLEV